MDTNNIKENIKNVKNPIIFLYLLLSHKNDIGDYYLSYILRLFMCYHTDIVLSYRIKKIFMDQDLPLTIDVINHFYFLVRQKFSYLSFIKQFYDIYKNKNFWSLNVKEQINFIENKYEHFKSVFDVSKGGTIYQSKLLPVLAENKINRYFVLNDTVDRLKIIVDLLGFDICKVLEIPLIKVSDFYELNNNQIIGYLNMIYERYEELFSNTLKLFENYLITSDKIDNLLNPVLINIFDTNIDIDLDYSDIFS
jgi:hypothetical protein